LDAHPEIMDTEVVGEVDIEESGGVGGEGGVRFEVYED
jgi:hypothetical protein